MTSGVIQTDSTVCGAAIPSNNLMAYAIGHASTHMNHTISCIVLHNGVLSADQTASINWLRAQYTGDSESTVTETSETKCYQFGLLQKSYLRVSSPTDRNYVRAERNPAHICGDPRI